MIDNKINNEISETIFRMNLANYRKQNNITQAQVAERSGLSLSCVANIEKGRNSPMLESVIKYCDAIGLEIYVNLTKKDE